MYEITYQEFLKSLQELSFMNSYVEDQQYSMQELICEDEILYFYPKNYLFKEKPLEETQLLFLSKDKIRIVSFLKEGFINIEDRRLSSVAKINISHKNRNSSLMTISFSDGDTFVLDSVNDSENHRFKLHQVIIEIYKYFK
ncbi:DUF3908 family protein [Sporosarcina luteola]|uniref:DUF3908 family protein n=1 Tax=Sporosarcina luteola TaxID=582850 RepID=UPI002040C2FE|nr:DUF3908 family protein [Sporosarcina luteola]MCM3712353.1 DUF3908 family protein [Sporosarcina luteola]